MIKLAIIGATGKMGQEIIRQVNLTNNQYNIVAKISSKESIWEENIKLPIDVCIDFSTPTATLEVLNYCIEFNVPLVIGTTGFNHEELQKIHQAANYIPILISPNMSLSVNLLVKLTSIVAKTLPDFESEIFEAHHKHKKDAPSGTAIKLGKCIALARNIDFDSHAVYNRQGRELSKRSNEIGFSVMRAGNIVGVHEVSFISESEQLVLKSEITNRDSFARGALCAASFIHKKNNGIYSMEDIFKI